MIIAGDYHRARRAMPSARKLTGGLAVIGIAGDHGDYRTMESVSRGITRLRAAAIARRRSRRASD